MNATIEQLQSLKLFGMLDAWVEQQSLPTYHDLSFDERLALLVEREHLRRVHLRQQRRLKAAQLPLTSASIEAIDYARPRGLSKAQVLQLAQGHWLAQHLQLIVMGPTGIGKTFLASCLATHWCQLGHAVAYFKTHDLLTELKLAKADGSFPKLRKRLDGFELLILDEWLRDALSVNDARELLDLLDGRYRQRSCLFATQLPIEQWHPQIQDPTLADAILDRIVHDAIRLSLRGESMRKVTSPLNPPNPDSIQAENRD
jgi:DNA replication protein DnaC